MNSLTLISIVMIAGATAHATRAGAEPSWAEGGHAARPTAPSAGAVLYNIPAPPRAGAGGFGAGFVELSVTGRSRDLGHRPDRRGGGLVDIASLPDLGAVELLDQALPRFQRQTVDFPSREQRGTIVIDTGRKLLYLVAGGGKALRYGIGVGREGFIWRGSKTISMKREWPEWRPPAEMLLRRPDLPRYMPGGLANPLGARALYLGGSLYRIHGTNEPATIGHNVSSGCIRLTNEDVSDLYDRVAVGARVVVI